MAESVDAEAEEKARQAKQLKFLAVVGLAALVANRERFLGKSKKPRGRRGRRVAATGNRTPGAARGAPRRAAGRSGGTQAKAALTPQMIPQLDDQTKQQIRSIKEERSDLIPEDEIRYETRNPFIALNLDDRAIIKQQEDAAQAARGGGTTLAGGADEAGNQSLFGTIFFRGVLPIGGQTYAIMEASGRRIPFYVKEGENLPGTPFRLLRLGPGSAFATLVNDAASNVRDKILTVPRSGVNPVILQRAKRLLLQREASNWQEDSRRPENDEAALVGLMLEYDSKRRAEAAPAAGGGPAEGGFLKPEVEASDGGGSGPEANPPNGSAGGADPEETAAEDDFTFFEE